MSDDNRSMRKNYLAQLLVAILLIAIPINSAHALENKRDQGIKLYTAKNFKQAILLLDQHLAVYPQDIYALYYDALACQGIGNMGKAKIYYRQVATLAPGHQLGAYARAVLAQIDPGFKGGSSRISSSASLSSSAQPYSIDSSIPMEWDVPCEPAEHGVWVDVKIEGHPVKMVLDTGAPTVAIGKNQMEEVGLTVPNVTNPTAETKAGYFPMKVKVGPVERAVMVHILDFNHGTPLIGQTYVGLFEYTIDPGAKRIHFRQRGYSKGVNRNANMVPFVFVKSGNRIVVQVELNGRSMPYIFDTGNTASGIIFHNSAQAEKYGVRIPPDAEATFITGVAGTTPARKFIMPRVRLGSIDRADVTVTVQETNTDELPLLGQPFWQGYEYTINREKSVIEFVRR